MAKLVTVFVIAAAISLSSAETMVKVDVDEPTLTVVPKNSVVPVNHMAIFECIATGNPPPLTMWQADGQRELLLVPGDVQGRFAVTEDGELQISHVTQEDEGNYTCSAFGGGYWLSTATAHLRVMDINDELQEACTKASDWLKSQHNDQWGWEHTPSIIMTLQLTNQTWFNRTDLEVQLNVKQLEIELLTLLSTRKMVPSYGSKGAEKNAEKDLSAGHLAYFILALHATCHNVSDFFGHDLIRLLEHKMRNFPVDNFNNHFQYSLALLALCNTNSLVKHRYVQDVTAGQDINGGYFYDNKETTAMVVTAMSCLANMTQFTNDTTVNSTLHRGVRNLIDCQQEDGSFGNVHSTALAYQALTAAGVPPTTWQYEEVLRSILEEQDDDGSFNGHLMTTMQVLPSLVGKHYGDMNTEMCNAKERTDEEEQDAITLLSQNNSEGTFIVKISVIDMVNNGKELATYNVYIPPETNLYSIMEALAEFTEGDFNYVAPDTAWGHYVQAMYDIEGDNVKETYWSIYRNDLEPLAVGVDDYYPKDGDHMIFKLMHLTYIPDEFESS